MPLWCIGLVHFSLEKPNFCFILTRKKRSGRENTTFWGVIHSQNSRVLINLICMENYAIVVQYNKNNLFIRHDLIHRLDL
jgi:hypothetical protein